VLAAQRITLLSVEEIKRAQSTTVMNFAYIYSELFSPAGVAIEDSYNG